MINLTKERLNRGYELPEAALQIGVTYDVLRRAEQGTRPRAPQAKAIADFYGVNVTDIWPIDQGDDEAGDEVVEADRTAA